MAPRKSKAQNKSSSATATAETAEKTVPEVAQQETTASAVASDPSGKSVPDGTNSKGDAAGDNGAAPENANGTASASQSAEVASGAPASASESGSSKASEVAADDKDATALVGQSGTVGNDGLAGSEGGDSENDPAPLGFDLSSGDAGVATWGSFQGTKDEFAAAFPNLHAALKSLMDADHDAPITKLSVKAHKDGYRRGGLKHTKAGQEFTIEELEPKQIEDLLADPRTKVEFV